MDTLRPFGPDIWIAEGPVVRFYGLPYSTRMAAIRLGDGSLLIWSPIALTDGLRGAVDALGKVAHLVSPNSLHHLFLGEWKKAYPQAKLYASPGLAKRRRDLAFDAELGDVPQPEWAGEIDQVAMLGSVSMTEIVFLHRKSRSAIFADLIKNFAPDWFRGWRGVLARLGGIVQPRSSTPGDWRLSFVNRKAARAALARILAFAPERVVIAHGDLVERDGAAFIRRAFAWLAK
jgi:hypothetical protein